MRKRLIGAVFFVLACGFQPLAADSSSMTDAEVIEYVQEALAQGKDQQTIAVELLQKGATQDQLLRLQTLYLSSGTTTTGTSGESSLTDLLGLDSRTRSVNGTDESTSEETEDYLLSDEMKKSRKNREALKTASVSEDDVFGRNIFNAEYLTFEPNNNVATPADYCLGPGDEVIIDIWGSSEQTIRKEISPDGCINIPDLGMVCLGGMKMDEAREMLKKELKKIYADPGNNIQITLGNIRTIQVNVMGEVKAPGSYVLSSFSTVFHALYASGGMSDIGSLRNVKVSRAGKEVATLDVYDYILNGRIEDDIRLQDGDVVIVPPYEEMVKIKGRVKRPMFYEMKQGETLSTLLGYAGGFTADAYKTTVGVVRRDGREYSVSTVDETDFSVFKTKDGDVVSVDSILNRYANKLEVRGAVYHPGVYELGGALNTVRQLVEKADGLLGDAFLARAVLYRERENLTKEVKSVDIKGIMEGTSPDVPLQKNDILYIPSIHDLQDLGSVRIYGEVNKPGEYTYADEMSLEDLVITAGGLKESASTVRVDISRRIRDPQSTSESATIGENFTFRLKDGFVIDGEPGFILQPYDEVFVRRSPGYSEQRNVTVTGEVLYEGDYALHTKNERLSSVITRAGGVNSFAYVRGTKLLRVANQDELDRMEDVISMISKEIGAGMVSTLGLKVDTVFSVGIDLEAALANPGGDADIVLREGDMIVVPEYTNTVKVNGAVMMPNTVSYRDGQKVKYYLDQAGGYSNNAKKKQKFIIYMNGQVAKVKGSGKDQVEPGCEIVVPAKTRNMNWATLMSNASSFASLATMIASLAVMLN